MGQVSVQDVLVDAEPETVLAAAADYQAMRPKLVSPHYSDYRVLAGARRRHTRACQLVAHDHDELHIWARLRIIERRR